MQPDAAATVTKNRGGKKKSCDTLRNKAYKRVLPEGLRFYPEIVFASEEPFFKGRVYQGLLKCFHQRFAKGEA